MTPVAGKVDLDIPGKNEVFLGFHDICDQFDWSLNSIGVEKFSFFSEILHTNQEKKIRFLFDDGFESAAKLSISNPSLFLPFRPVMSIITSQISGKSIWDKRPGGTRKIHIDKKLLRILSESGWEIISHTHSHLAMDWLSKKQIIHELSCSQMILEDCIGKPVTSLSFPFGRYNQKVLDACAEAGFSTFYSNRKQAGNVTRVYSVYRWDTASQLFGKVNQNKGESLRLKSINLFSAGTVWVQALTGLYSEPKEK